MTHNEQPVFCRVGSAHLLGYKLVINFRMPFLSANIAEFWRRWHISLSSWLREYLYFPLGGNRRGVPVPRCIGDGHDVVDFDTFCARALAGIGSAVPDTIVDRRGIALIRRQSSRKR